MVLHIGGSYSATLIYVVVVVTSVERSAPVLHCRRQSLFAAAPVCESVCVHAVFLWVTLPRGSVEELHEVKRFPPRVPHAMG